MRRPLRSRSRSVNHQNAGINALRRPIATQIRNQPKRVPNEIAPLKRPRPKLNWFGPEQKRGQTNWRETTDILRRSVNPIRPMIATRETRATKKMTKNEYRCKAKGHNCRSRQFRVGSIVKDGTGRIWGRRCGLKWHICAVSQEKKLKSISFNCSSISQYGVIYHISIHISLIRWMSVTETAAFLNLRGTGRFGSPR